MYSSKENSVEKRRRKVITQPVLVRSVKAGSALSATYDRTTRGNSFWKAA